MEGQLVLSVRPLRSEASPANERLFIWPRVSLLNCDVIVRGYRGIITS